MFMKVQLIGSKLVQGSGVGDESTIGKLLLLQATQEAAAKMQKGDILVVKTTDKDYLPAIEKAAALVVETGSLTSHAAVVGTAMGIPVVVGAENGNSVISDGQIITADSRRGIVYKGATNAL